MLDGELLLDREPLLFISSIKLLVIVKSIFPRAV